MSKKICILTDSLSSGGAERVAANMSISLSTKGYNVFIVSMKNNIDYLYKGELYNFGVIKEEHSRLKSFFKFKKFFKENKFDVIIDHRLRNNFFKEVIFSNYVFRNNRVIYCVHNYKLEYYFSFGKIPWLTSLHHVKDKMFVAVSEEIRKKLKQKLNIESKTVYNFLSVNDFSISLNENQFSSQDYILGVGRLTEIKQFHKLVKSYYYSELPKAGIKLFILGDGPEKKNIECQISELELENHVKLLPFRKNPYDIIRNAKALALVSKVEGFPMVLLEAVSLNTPIVAFNCKSGPSEIVINEVNGLLVENQNEEQLTNALNKLLIDNYYYKKIKANTHIGLEKFSEENVIQQWINLLENQI